MKIPALDGLHRAGLRLLEKVNRQQAADAAQARALNELHRAVTKAKLELPAALAEVFDRFTAKLDAAAPAEEQPAEVRKSFGTVYKSMDRPGYHMPPLARDLLARPDGDFPISVAMKMGGFWTVTTRASVRKFLDDYQAWPDHIDLYLGPGSRIEAEGREAVVKRHGRCAVQ